MSKMLSIGEVCRRLGGDEKPLDVSTVHKWVKKGWLPRQVKIGRLSRWREHEVDYALEHLQERLEARREVDKAKLKWSVATAKATTD